jgi:outer membrane assembly lipoprotein YfiO
MLGLVFVTAGLVSCSSTSGNLPLAGTLGAADPRAEALLAKAQAAEAAGKMNKATKAYKEVAEKYPYAPAAPKARFRHATILDSEGELVKAFDSYQIFIERYQADALYSKALARQATVAHAAADGIITNSFVGIKTRLDRKKTTEMLAKVRENAPQAGSAPKAQFAIGQVWEREKDDRRAVIAYQLLVDDYPDSSYAPEAQYRIGDIYLQQAKSGNQNPATLDQSRHAFEDLLQLFPNSKRAKDARARLAELSGRDVQRSFDIGEFYYKKKNYTSASFYYNEVLRKVKSGPLHDKAAQRLAQLKGT